MLILNGLCLKFGVTVYFVFKDCVQRHKESGEWGTKKNLYSFHFSFRFSFFPVPFLEFATGKVGNLSPRGCVGVLADFGLPENIAPSVLQVGEYADAIYQMATENGRLPVESIRENKTEYSSEKSIFTTLFS
ncbi:MAG: hypothetical protein LBQ50_11360 [Planctomycetaceae bacterium]|nr:hypothetical protein [Planctomycetaceae bacterium]